MSASVADIEFTETAYGLDDDADAWLGSLASSANRILGRGFGVMALYFQNDADHQVRLGRIEAVDCDPELVERRRRFAESVPPAMVPRLFRTGAGTFRESTAGLADADALFEAAYGGTGMQDAMAAVALDPDGQGVLLIAGLPDIKPLDVGHRDRVWRLTVHLAAGARLRRGLVDAGDAVGETATGLPLCGEAVLDPTSGNLVDAAGEATRAAARERLREGVRAMERARGPRGRRDPERAMAIWRGLVDGRWSLVDFFDSDGRRFLVARPNPPSVRDARGLSPREQRVVAFAALGESNKAIGYRLGLTSQAVSRCLSAAQRKLGVENRTQLIRRLAPFVRSSESE